MPPGTSPGILEPYIPHYDVREVHTIVVDAPAEAVFAAACALDIEAIPLVRALFAVRAALLGARFRARQSRGLIADMTAIGWTPLARAPASVVMGSITEPWDPQPRFRAVDPQTFAALDEPGHVKIAWTLESTARSPASTLFRTETRAVATDARSRRRFRWYWLAFGLGTALIRSAALRRLKHVCEASRTVRRRPV